MIHVRALGRRPEPADLDPSPERLAALERAFDERGATDVAAAWTSFRSRTPITADPLDDEREPGPIGRRRGVDRSPTIDFGRYAGWSLTMIARRDPDYLDWLARSPIGRTWRPAILEVLQARPKSA
jgi:hypothetical protein